MEQSVPTCHDEPPGCEMLARLSAYYDGELDATTASAIESHLRTCDACRAELEEIRELSSMAREVGAEGMSREAVVRAHRNIEDESRSASIFRIGGILTGLAASALIIGAAWLYEMPGQKQTYIVINPRGDRNWETVAMLDMPPSLPQSPWEVRDQQMFADARLADWMVEGLTGRQP